MAGKEEANKMASESPQESNEATMERSEDQQASSSQLPDTRTSVQKKEKYRFAANIPSDKTAAEQEYADYILENDEDDAKIPDVLLDVPVVKVDEINFELNDLRVRANLYAKVLDLVELAVGVDAYLGRVKLVITGVEVQALLKVRLDNVAAILDRVLTTIDRNPQIVERLVEGVSSAVEDIGAGAGSAVRDIGAGARAKLCCLRHRSGGRFYPRGPWAGAKLCCCRHRSRSRLYPRGAWAGA